ncbi:MULTISPECIES: helix-turn-helix domain-containing protein [Streptomyces]|uniref:XRE family transcriptional regulator n=1 Tax=Streptomyces venezuelae TaxID=54571 RepID=A0A5P2B964_STRVZ|nr:MULTISPECIES: helix-turn-helix domain-containing protein [Streptomyces]NDZ99843.1 helix-turn-helix domain-containing protein [Streptomyces sp. SID10116]MYY86388.1 helix-turn-helix domain-containing protein [Streptomyces sp. SID335]MYZ14519.1 helix-turn-helix domain-containing protein [Streptomyces sp. SID337]NDZ88268.1 helix-turn-helix domain-containing protein [Streptomyces sp. SID10115]NEB44874.1 helix-turn-helix domain-containing protein [Streptomyces sp. SID339]
MATTRATSALRSGLGGFLRAHRERVSPGDVGLPDTARRRAKGLRREEVAALSGVSVAWYTWLEQGRVDTSRHVLDAVARALRLDDASHRHALVLAGFAPGEVATADVPAAVEPGLVDMIESWPDSPAVVLGPTLDLLAWNRAYVDVWPDPTGFPDDGRRNLLLLLVGDGAHQRVLGEWEPVVVDLYRHLRSRADRHPGDEAFERLTARLRSARPELDDWWACRSVGDFTPRTVRLTSHRDPAPRSYGMNLLHTRQGPRGAVILVMTPRAPGSPGAPASGAPRP